MEAPKQTGEGMQLHPSGLPFKYITLVAVVWNFGLVDPSEIRSFMRINHGVVGIKVWEGTVGPITATTKAALKTLIVEDVKKRRGRKEANLCAQDHSMTLAA